MRRCEAGRGFLKWLDSFQWITDEVSSDNYTINEGWVFTCNTTTSFKGPKTNVSKPSDHSQNPAAEKLQASAIDVWDSRWLRIANLIQAPKPVSHFSKRLHDWQHAQRWYLSFHETKMPSNNGTKLLIINNYLAMTREIYYWDRLIIFKTPRWCETQSERIMNIDTHSHKAISQFHGPLSRSRSAKSWFERTTGILHSHLD